MEDYEKKEAEKKVKPASKRKSDIKFVHENGDVSSVGDDTPKKKRGRGDTKEDKEPSPVTPEDSKRGGRAGKRSISYNEYESPKEDKSKRGKKDKVVEEDNQEVGAEEEEYEVEKILDVRKARKGKEYLVKWKGWEREEDRTWEPEASLEGSRELVKEFNDKRSAQEQSVSTPGPASSKKKGRKSVADNEENTSQTPASGKKRGRAKGNEAKDDAVEPMVMINLDDSDNETSVVEPKA